MFKKFFIGLVVLAVLAGGGGVAWFKLMRPVDPFAAAKAAMLEELLYWTIRSEDPLPRAKYLPKVSAHNWFRE